MYLNTVLAFSTVLYTFSRSAPIIERPKRNIAETLKHLEYFNKFGYIQDRNGGILGELVDEETALKSAVSAFQKVWQLPVTGELNEDTVKLMKSDRCGNGDDALFLKSQGITKRYVRESAWTKTHLTYKLVQYSNKLRNEDVDNAFKIAFRMWAEQSPLTFSERDTYPDIEIKFAVNDHGDYNPFDGPGGTLGHAFFPDDGGDLHMDDDENWTYFTTSGREITQSVVHELGHSLGLGHSNDYNSIMYPYYRYRPDLKLGRDDIEGIQFIYGNVRNSVQGQAFQQTTTEEPPSVEKWCRMPKFDAILYDTSGELYAFQNDEIAHIFTNGVRGGYPIKTTIAFPNLQGKVDAAILLPTVYGCKDRTTFNCELFDQYFFQESNVVIYRDGILQRVKKIVDTFPGIPNNIDSVFTRNGGKTLYFTKGSSIYRYTRGIGVDRGYPKKIKADFPELPNKIDAALTYPFLNDGTTFYANMIFSGTKYYMLSPNPNRNTLSIVPPSYPRPIALWWLRCPKKLGELKDSSSNKTLVSFQTESDKTTWAKELLGFKPGLPKSDQFFDQENRLVNLSAAKVSIIPYARQVYVDKKVNPQDVGQPDQAQEQVEEPDIDASATSESFASEINRAEQTVVVSPCLITTWLSYTVISILWWC